MFKLFNRNNRKQSPSAGAYFVNVYDTLGITDSYSVYAGTDHERAKRQARTLYPGARFTTVVTLGARERIR